MSWYVSTTCRSTDSRSAFDIPSSRFPNRCVNLSGCHRMAATRRARARDAPSSKSCSLSSPQAASALSNAPPDDGKGISFMVSMYAHTPSLSVASLSFSNRDHRDSCDRHALCAVGSTPNRTSLKRSHPSTLDDSGLKPAALMRCVSLAFRSEAAASRSKRARAIASWGVRGASNGTRVFFSPHFEETSLRARNSARSEATLASSVAASRDAAVAVSVANRAREATSSGVIENARCGMKTRWPLGRGIGARCLFRRLETHSARPTLKARLGSRRVTVESNLSFKVLRPAEADSFSWSRLFKDVLAAACCPRSHSSARRRRLETPHPDSRQSNGSRAKPPSLTAKHL